MTRYGDLESILVVFQNPAEGRMEPYDDWYTNVHIRDAMRLDGALATQRFITGERPLVHRGQTHACAHWAHTIYEWSSAQASVDGHNERAATPEMEISRDGVFEGLRDFFFRPVHLSDGWSLEQGFRPGGRHVLTAMVTPKGDPAAFAQWFEAEYVPAIKAVPGVGSVGLFSIHEAQSLPYACVSDHVIVHSLTDADAALDAFAQNGPAADALDALKGRADFLELTVWQPRIERLLARDVLDPPEAAAREQARARAEHRGSYVSRQEILDLTASLDSAAEVGA